MISRRLCSLILLSVCLAGAPFGCGDSSRDFVVTSSSGQSPSQVIAMARTGASGSFTFPADAALGVPDGISGTVAVGTSPAGLPVELLSDATGLAVQVTLPSGQQLRTEVPEGATWVWVTPVTHIASAFHQSHRDLSREQAVDKVKNYLGLAPEDSIERPFVGGARSRFSPDAFFAAVSSAGGLQALTQNVIADIDAGTPRHFRDNNPLNTPQLPLGGSPFLSRADVRAQEGEIVAEVAEKSLMKQIAGKAGEATAKGAASGGTKKLMGWVAGLCGLSNSTEKELEEISQQLDTISDQITALSGDTEEAAALDLATSIADDVTAMEGLYSEEQTTVKSASGYVPDSPTSDTSFLKSLVSELDYQSAVDAGIAIINACLNSGTGNLITGNNEAVGTKWGSGVQGTKPSAFFYDFRYDPVTVKLQNAASYYTNRLGQAANAVSESAHQALNDPSSNPRASLTRPQVVLNGSSDIPSAQTVGGNINHVGWMAANNRILQQAPMALLGGSSAMSGLYFFNGTLASSWSGTLFSNAIHEVKSNGKDSGISIDSALGYTTDGLKGFNVISLREAQYLCQVADAVAVADQVTSNKIPYGLHQLGILTDTNYSSSLSSVQFYCNYNGNTGSGDPNARTLQVYSSSDFDSSNPTSSSAGGNGVYFNGSSYVFRPQGDGNVVLVVLSSQVPSANFTQAEVPVPIEVAQAAHSASSTGWNSTLPLAFGLAPEGIAISVDPKDPYQLRATAYWHWSTEASGSSKVWCDVTNLVEWLSSDVSLVEVSNYEWLRSDPNGLAGVLNIHNNESSVTITASMLKSPYASSPVNTTSSTASYVTGTYTVPAKFNPEHPGQTFVPALQELMITPDNFKVHGTLPRQFHALGRNDDLRFVDMDTQVDWSVQGSPAGLSIDSTGYLTFGSDYTPSGQTVTIVATPKSGVNVDTAGISATAQIITLP
jgi:hypothetical protein